MCVACVLGAEGVVADLESRVELARAGLRRLDGLAAVGGGAALPFLAVGFLKVGEVVGIGLDGRLTRAGRFAGRR